MKEKKKLERLLAGIERQIKFLTNERGIVARKIQRILNKEWKESHGKS